MAIPRKFLGKDERVIITMRTHGKAMILPIIGFLAVLAVTSALVVIIPDDWRSWGHWVIGALSLIGFVWLFVLPLLRWLNATYTLTDRRIITRQGILNKTGHDVPLTRINNVTYDRSIIDRVLGCGTLVFTTAAEEPLSLPDVPHVERVHVMVTELLFGNTVGAEAVADELEGRKTGETPTAPEAASEAPPRPGALASDDD
ncbi:PH domain-containing protein [Rarobacter faecitabidus]|uniref:PH (Pleckstrin Homology) domain-containing protein n=1 Tax=Rarobacter faecitabidus TaxID=13243 RepID=A0A542ZAW3_RARFA|nr:PH domain-containing protein [Rarobacter faecitabidus]TQL57380.1 PH (Pleckstrin Homology) domain-containing protein [Rarobacter faecitabidus]